MSREFGSCIGGYFHDKIRNAADDCKESSGEITKLWGEFLEEFAEVAYQISNYEAGDSGVYAPIMESIDRLPKLKRSLEKIDNYLYDYKRVAEEAVRLAAEKTK